MKRTDKLNSLLNASATRVVLDEKVMEVSPLAADPEGPLLYRPSRRDVDLKGWLQRHREEINGLLLKHGGILFSAFDLATPEIFRETSMAINGQLMEYVHRSSPRTQVSEKVYTSTDHPADQFINMHNEMCYATNWPMKIIFGCMQPADNGGETPIADSRKIFNALRPEVRSLFQEKGVKYVRNLSSELGLDWQHVFQTTDREVVAQHCRDSDMLFTWLDDEHLRLEWVRPAVRIHPATGEQVWFNHAYFFNAATLEPTLRKIMKEEYLPFNTFLGDGTPIPEDVIHEIATAYKENLVVFKWAKGDFLLLDNMLMAHGRFPFEGTRKIVVSMNEPRFPA